jgi:phosphonate transport system substrate-binding protein
MLLFFRSLQFFVLGLVCCQFTAAGTLKEIIPLTEWSKILFNSSETLYQPTFVKQNSSTKIIYKVGIHPLHNPKRLFEVYAPLIDLFNAAIPEATFVLESSRNYEEFEKKLYAGYFDFAMPNPYQTINAVKYGYHVFAKMGDDKDFRGIILVRVDSNINNVLDLKGKVVAYPSKTALAATLMPQYYLQTHGLNVNTDIENRYVGSQESAIMNVLNRKVAAGATWSIPWNAFVKNEPRLAEQLNVKWETESLINNSWMAKKNTSPEIITKLNNVLLNLSQTNEGKAILATIPISKFEAANDATYEPIKAFVTKFNQTVRPLN